MIKKYENMLNMNATITKKLFDRVDYPWEVLPFINDYILEIIPTFDSDYIKLKNDVYVHKTVKIEEGAYINGPTIICENSVIRHNAYIRGSVIIGKSSVIGNSTEVKNSILFDKVECPHFNYVGDSVLGEHAHLGAGVILSNVRSDKKEVNGLRKCGSILGNNAEIGCNSVLCPGTIIGENSSVYPLTMVKGEVESNMIIKSTYEIVKKK